MRKIAVALSKGGVGKTTTAVNLAAGLAQAGQQVLLIDVDTQGQVSRSLGLRPDDGLARLISETKAAPEVVGQARDNLWLLSGGRGLAGVERLIIRKDFGGERTLSEAMSTVNRRYDYVILDTSPGWDVLTVNALFFAEEVLAPVSLEVMTLQGLQEFAQSLSAIQRYHQDLRLRYILPTFLDRRVKKSTEILQQLHRYYGDTVCEPIRYNVRLSEAPGYGQTIFEYAPRSTGAKDYQTFTERILQDG